MKQAPVEIKSFFLFLFSFVVIIAVTINEHFYFRLEKMHSDNWQSASHKLEGGEMKDISWKKN